jgi:UDP-N-acetylglucosamine transferase subunit ALG13
MKVFVAAGTGSFDALIREADALPHDVVCQIGGGTYAPKRQQWFRTCPSLEPWYDWADIIVTHAGAGTMLEALAHGKTVIAVPNLQRTDAHQHELLNELAAQDAVTPCRTVRDLPKTITLSTGKPRKKYLPPQCSIPAVINSFLRGA